jgi:hypothetical protein
VDFTSRQTLHSPSPRFAQRISMLGWRTDHTAMKLLPTSAQERRLRKVFQPRS